MQSDDPRQFVSEQAPPKKVGVRSAGLSVVTAVLALLVGIGIFETAMRLTEYRFLLHKTEFPPGYFQADAELGADQARNVPPGRFTIRAPAFEAFTNWLGCFDRDSDISPGYILAIGDSATWGFVPSDENWTHRLQELAGTQVLNCGVTGVGPKFEAIKAEKVIERIGFPPSLMIVLYIDNDLNDDFVFPSYTVVDGQRLDRVRAIDLETGRLDKFSNGELTSRLRDYATQQESLKTWLKQNSLTAWMLFSLRERLAGGDEGAAVRSMTDRYGVDLWNVTVDDHDWLRAAIDDHMNAMVRLQEVADKYSVPLVVFEDRTEDARPSPHRSEFSETLRTRLRLVHAIEFSEDTGITSEQIHHRFDDHWNATGNRLVAELMYESLRRDRLLSNVAEVDAGPASSEHLTMVH